MQIKKDYAKMKDEVNVIGRKYGFTETEFRKRGKNSRTAAEKKNYIKRRNELERRTARSHSRSGKENEIARSVQKIS